MTPREVIQKYLDREIDFPDLWYALSKDPEVNAGWETIQYYDVWSNQMKKGRFVPEELELDLRERLKSLLRREGWK